MRGTLLVLAGVAAIAVVPDRAMEAQSSSASLQVTANVIKNCTIATAPISFGAYDPVTANATQPLDGIGTITVTCTRGVAAHVSLSLGSNGSGGSRRMQMGGFSYLTYEIYKDASRSDVWGAGFDSNLDIPSAPSVEPRTFTAYGRVPARQDAAVGNYLDIVLATVNF
jgi:spore coat protein U-like protein